MSRFWCPSDCANDCCAPVANGRATRRRPIWNDPDLTILRRDGEEVPVEVSRSPLALDQGSWVVVAIRDVSTQRASEQARADAELRFRVAFENNMAPMTFADANDRIIAVNDAMCQMVGFTKEELLGCDSTPFTYPDDVGITESTHQRLISGEVEQERYVKRYLRKDGRRHRRRGLAFAGARRRRQDPVLRLLRTRHHRGARPRGAALAPGPPRSRSPASPTAPSSRTDSPRPTVASFVRAASAPCS